jgi:hypothetical protein
MLKYFTRAGAISLCLLITLPATKLSAQQVSANQFFNYGLSCSNEGNSYYTIGIIILKKASNIIKGITINPNPGLNGVTTVGFTGDEIQSVKFTIAR